MDYKLTKNAYFFPKLAVINWIDVTIICGLVSIKYELQYLKIDKNM